VRYCTVKLNEAEKKIELLTKKADGSVAATPLEPGDTVPPVEREETLL